MGMAQMVNLEGTEQVDALRTRQIATGGLDEIFPAESRALLERFDDFALRPEDAADAVLAMTSGLLDGLTGQVLCLDRGSAYLDNLMTVGPVLAGASS